MRPFRRYGSVCQLLTFVAVALASAAATGTECFGNRKAAQSYRVDVVPQVAPATLFSHWAPVLEEIGKITGLCLELRIAPSIPAFEQELLAGRPDFAFVNPYHLMMARRAQSYVPLVRDSKVQLSGLLLVRNDSDISELRQLDGKKLAFPAPNAFAASLLIRAELAAKGIRIEPVYVKTHANVFRAIAIGDVPAGGAVNNTMDRESAGLRSRLRVIHETASYAPHPFIAHTRVPRALRDKLAQAFIQLAASAAGQKMLDDIQMPRPVIADYTQDYAPLERLQLDKLVAGSDG